MSWRNDDDHHALRNPTARQREVRALLLDWDPIGVADVPHAPRDEYDCLIEPLLRQLAAGASSDDVASWLAEDLQAHFGLPSDPGREASFAARLVSWWRARSSEHGPAH